MSMTTKSSAWSGTSRSTDPGFDSAALPRSALPPRGTPKTDWRAVLSNEAAQVSLIGVVISHEGALYVYGGLIGRVHAHSIENISPGFRRLVLSPGRTWEKLARGRRLRGTALAADGAAIDHRIGGWELCGPHETGFTNPRGGYTTLPKANLRAETSDNIEVSVRTAFDRAQASASPPFRTGTTTSRDDGHWVQSVYPVARMAGLRLSCRRKGWENYRMQSLTKGGRNGGRLSCT